MSKNFSKGEVSESKVSLSYHSNHKAVLLSPLLLRRLNLGQIDVAYVSNRTLYLIEVKSSEIGIYISRKQKLRILKTADFLRRLLNMNIKVIYLNGCQMNGHYLT